MTHPTSNERVEFEKWLLATHGLADRWDERRNCYERFPAHLAFCAWQAARSTMRQDETACSKPSSSDTPESALQFVVGVAKDQRFSNEYLGNVVRSWLQVLEGSSEEPTERRRGPLAPAFDAARKLVDHQMGKLPPLKAPVKAGNPCPTFDEAVHEEHKGKCVYCGAPMLQTGPDAGTVNDVLCPHGYNRLAMKADGTHCAECPPEKASCDVLKFADQDELAKAREIVSKVKL